FPRKIGRYAIADQVITLEHAVRSSSGLPADILKLPERGYLKTGYFADVVVFDPEKFRDQATFDRPHQYAAGVRYLFVNGKLVIEEGKYKDVHVGKVLGMPGIEMATGTLFPFGSVPVGVGCLHETNSKGIQDLLPTGSCHGLEDHPVQAFEIRN